MEEINRNIDDNEILIRIIFSPKHYSRSNKKFHYNEIFVPYKGGVSLNRYKYSNENLSKKQGLAMENLNFRYKGVVLFKKKMIFSELENYLSSTNRKNLDIEIRATPLDEKEKIIPEGTKVFTTDKGNPSHADIIYSPEHIPSSEPRKARAFSKYFAKALERENLLILDSNPEEKLWSEKEFISYF